METIRIKTNSREYDVLTGEELLVPDNFHDADNKEVLLVVDDGVPSSLIEKVEKILTKKSSKFHSLIMEASEEKKSFSSLEEIHNCLIEMGYSRECILYAMGGGIICDMTGFAAATYQRGVDFVLIPTTLLSQVDASVGGKTAINHKKGKNMIGAFHQPKKVISDVGFLSSLESRQLTDGLSEIIKHAAILDKEFFVWLEENIYELLHKNSSLYEYAVSRSIQLKESVVSRDETEKGVRKWLNFGHTFGHAIEASKNYKGILHGEAISVGMNIAAAISADQGYLSHDEYCNIEDMLLNMQMPTMIPKKITSASIMKHIGHDKKKISGKNRFILLDKIGNAFIDDKLDNKYLKEVSKNFIR